MAERTGLEPATPGVTGRCSNQLSYRSAVLADGREPMERPDPAQHLFSLFFDFLTAVSFIRPGMPEGRQDPRRIQR